MLESIESIRKQIIEHGAEKIIENLVSANFSDFDREELEKKHILINGYPNLSLILDIS